ncbi:hypothetical protein BDF21DRAFT_223150 [Thamnidium elegans]|nr:hypothetical protein BDF21DRAFT_223150 [Thamnidium elegans]
MLLFFTAKERLVFKITKSSDLLKLNVLYFIVFVTCLIPVLFSTRAIYKFAYNALFELSLYSEASDVFITASRILSQCIMCILFEAWKLWLTFDSVIYIYIDNLTKNVPLIIIIL